jgi:hypothetical protein
MSFANSSTLKALKNPIAPKVEMKSIKTAGGEETRRFEAKVYVDGVFAGIASNGGTGGGNHYRSADKDATAKLMRFIDTIPPEGPSLGGLGPLKVDLDFFLSEVLEAALLKRSFKKKTFFEVKTRVYSVNAPFDPRVKEHVLKQHPDAVFLNEFL